MRDFHSSDSIAVGFIISAAAWLGRRFGVELFGDHCRRRWPSACLYPGMRPLDEHWIRCRRCRNRFDLVRSEVCDCPRELKTRRCVHCGRCLCGEPVAQDEDWWIRVPERLRALGMEKIPIDYL
jgi:hypothetical protein